MVKPPKAETPDEEALELSSSKQLPEGVICFACSDDGRYLSLGHSRGLRVCCASSLNCAAEWLNDSLEVTCVQMTNMAEEAYLLGTIDDMGVARIFAYHPNSIHLLSVVNAMDDINKRHVCCTFELSQGGHYGAATMTCNGNVWLEVHHLPSENWLRELEKTVTPIQDLKSSRDADVKWSPLPAATKIKLPKIRAGSTSESLHEVHVTDFKTHCLSIDEDARRYSLKTDTESNQTSESPRRCTQHFLLPCGHFLVDSNAEARLATSSVAVCLWWTGSLNLLHYSLQKMPTHRSADHEPMPDMVWPNAKEILCSAVSRCTRYVALGLEDGLVCVWDRQSGSPLSVVLISQTDSPLLRMQFVDLYPVSHNEVHLSVVCKSGTIHTVTTGRGTPSSTVLVAERPKTSGDIATIFTPVPFLQNLFFVVQRNGKIFLQDINSKTAVCFFKPPKSQLVASSCIPVYALNTRQQMLFIRAATELLVFRFGEWDIFKPYIVSPADSAKLDTFSCVTLEESCNLYLQQRALTVEERNNNITQTWDQLQETVTTETERS